MLQQRTTKNKPDPFLLFAALVGCDLRTAMKWLEGYDVRGRFLMERLEREAKGLGLKRARLARP